MRGRGEEILNRGERLVCLDYPVRRILIALSVLERELDGTANPTGVGREGNHAWIFVKGLNHDKGMPAIAQQADSRAVVVREPELVNGETIDARENRSQLIEGCDREASSGDQGDPGTRHRFVRLPSANA